MRHKKHHHTLGLKTAHRRALLADLTAALIKHNRIKTTLAKARALRPFAEKIVTLAKKGTLHHRRLAIARVRNKDAVHFLFEKKVKEFVNRQGGYTRIYKLSDRRRGDAAEMALIEFVGANDQPHRRRSSRKVGKAETVKPTSDASVESLKPGEVTSSTAAGGGAPSA
jgi:large subunit ribosomal protein L17